MPEANTGDAPAVPAATLDFSVIESLRRLGGRQESNLLGELIDVFLVDARTRVSNIERASRKEDPAALEAAAHGLKSSAANLGLWRLSELCRQLERGGAHRTIGRRAVQGGGAEAGIRAGGEGPDGDQGPDLTGNRSQRRFRILSVG